MRVAVIAFRSQGWHQRFVLMANRILVLFAHPALEKSRVQKHLARQVEDMDGVTFHDLYETYPDLHINVAHEQSLLIERDIIVFQHPFYWYSCPAILKEWQDLVLEYGFAFGEGGNALAGKRMISAISTGGSEESYTSDGLNRYTIRELLAPFEQTARLCGMEYLPPFVVHGTHRLTKNDAIAHAADYCRVIEALRDDQLDFTQVRKLPRINADLPTLLPGGNVTP